MDGAEKMKKRFDSFALYPGGDGYFLRYSFYYYYAF